MSIVLDGTSGLTSPAAVLTTTPLAVTSGGTGVTTSTGTGAVVLGTSPTLTTPTFDSASLATISGTAPLYMCRAWVNFNGTGTVAIRASGNVSSITDGGVGDYTVNFTTALPDINYSFAASSSNSSQGVSDEYTGVSAHGTSSYLVGSLRIAVLRWRFDTQQLFDTTIVSVAILR